MTARSSVSASTSVGRLFDFLPRRGQLPFLFDLLLEGVTPGAGTPQCAERCEEGAGSGGVHRDLPHPRPSEKSGPHTASLLS